LRLSGEQEFPVLPLPVPDSTKHLAIEAVAAYAAIALFVERAARVRPDLTLAADNAATIAAICALLDGLPLAIELAAARVRALPPRTLLERLRHTANMPTLGLLTDGLRDAPNRQQTLRDTIAWSYALLSDEEQRLFRRLTVFADGCSLEAAEAICASMRDSASGDEPRVVAECSPKIHVLETLHSLVEKNLLSRAIGPDGAPRFRMLETIRAYASEMLAVSGEEGTLRRRHAQYYLEIVEAMGALLFAAPGTQARLAAEHGNVQAALQWLVQHG
jgi:predicted ATPase